MDQVNSLCDAERQAWASVVDTSDVQTSIAESPVSDDAEGSGSDDPKVYAFSKFPLEIRTKIYRYLMSSSRTEVIDITHRRRLPAASTQTWWAYEGLFSTSKGIRAEALPILFGENKIRLGLASASPSLCYAIIEPLAWQSIQDLHLQGKRAISLFFFRPWRNATKLVLRTPLFQLKNITVLVTGRTTSDDLSVSSTSILIASMLHDRIPQRLALFFRPMRSGERSPRNEHLSWMTSSR